jgi:acetyl-CoA decarbonylase/synthase complex subunit gamma
MALSGIQIFKFLPKTNCGECGVPTCLAFAMSLAAGKAELAKCPYVSDASKAALGEASAPPMRTVEIGAGATALKVGGEIVLYRHEKTFVNKTGIALLVTDAMSEAEVDARVQRFGSLSYERVGLTLKGDLIAVQSTTGDAAKFLALIARVKNAPDARFILRAEDPALLAQGAAALAGRKPLLYAATPDNAEAMAKVAKEAGCPLAVRADGLEALAALTQKLEGLGIKDLVLDSGARTLKAAFQDQVFTRRLALQKKFRPLGYPTILFPGEMTDDPIMEALYATTFIAKYGSIVVLSDLKAETLQALLLARLNLYTDPQRPMVTEAKLYEIGAVNENSPLLVTCNFALTYFILNAEIEASRIPTYLLIVDTEGLSVLTAWAAGKFAGDLIATAIKKTDFASKSKNRSVVIPGLAAIISGELEANLGSDWSVLIGPREASHLSAFMKRFA